MTTEGVDFSVSRPGGAALKAAGKAFVVRYVPYGGLAKGLTAAEVDDYQAHGLDIALVWESTTQRALSGNTAGAADGRAAQAAAAALGFPDTTAIYFAVDFDVADSGLPAVDAYLRGAAMILGAPRVGVYGGRRVVTHCKSAGTARWLWQTYAWSYGTVVAGIHLYQYKNGQSINGGSVDLDRAMQPDFGQWSAPLTGGTGGIDMPGLRAQVPSVPVLGTVHIPKGTPALRLSDASSYVPAGVPQDTTRIGYAIRLVNADGSTHGVGYQVNLAILGLAESWFVSADKVTFTPAAAPAATDCTAAVKAATDPLNATIASLQTDVATARAAGYADAKAKAVSLVEGI